MTVLQNKQGGIDVDVHLVHFINHYLDDTLVVRQGVARDPGCLIQAGNSGPASLYGFIDFDWVMTLPRTRLTGLSHSREGLHWWWGVGGRDVHDRQNF